MIDARPGVSPASPVAESENGSGPGAFHLTAPLKSRSISGDDKDNPLLGEGQFACPATPLSSLGGGWLRERGDEI